MIKASKTFFVSMALPSTVLGVRVALCKSVSSVATVLILCFLVGCDLKSRYL